MKKKQVDDVAKELDFQTYGFSESALD